MMFASSEIAPPLYYESVADEFDSVAEHIMERSSDGEDFAKALKDLARQIREGATWLDRLRDAKPRKIPAD